MRGSLRSEGMEGSVKEERPVGYPAYLTKTCRNPTSRCTPTWATTKPPTSPSTPGDCGHLPNGQKKRGGSARDASSPWCRLCHQHRLGQIPEPTVESDVLPDRSNATRTNEPTSR